MTPPKRKRGRPPIAAEAGKRFNVTITPAHEKQLRKIGKGSLSAGILHLFKAMFNP